ncbi:hypothetical protein HPB50_006214 [Hyalomma asiaticum]|uniref:Uncharacterized protein n=1 Tax=Hyalomma asiaticum TaxID=266040 RepID=A0ACB7RKH3_HYAAI|nr:hypothetical protein HPB50_006214 [Hyalomma asiaticum]
MKGQKTTRVRPASAGAGRNSRGTPPYSAQRQQHAQPQQDNAEASPTVPEGGRVLAISEILYRVPNEVASMAGVTRHVVGGYVIHESRTPFSTSYAAGSYAASTTSSTVGGQRYHNVSSRTPPYPRAVEDPGPSSASALTTAPEQDAPEGPDTFLSQTPVTKRTAAAAASAVLTPKRNKPAASSSGEKYKVPWTPKKAVAAKSKDRGPPQDVQTGPPCQDLTTPASSELPAIPPQRQQQQPATAQQDEKPPEKWTVEEVAKFVAGVPGCERFAEKFRQQQIDGTALFLIKEHHLVTVMNMKLGLALKMCATIDSLPREES